jgi:hypothetical protein
MAVKIALSSSGLSPMMALVLWFVAGCVSFKSPASPYTCDQLLGRLAVLQPGMTVNEIMNVVTGTTDYSAGVSPMACLAVGKWRFEIQEGASVWDVVVYDEVGMIGVPEVSIRRRGDRYWLCRCLSAHRTYVMADDDDVWSVEDGASEGNADVKEHAAGSGL